MRQRRVLLAMAALLAAITLAVSGCGGSQPESELTGTDTDDPFSEHPAGQAAQLQPARQ